MLIKAEIIWERDLNLRIQVWYGIDKFYEHKFSRIV
jgi:hypothetical protein